MSRAFELVDATQGDWLTGAARHSPQLKAMPKDAARANGDGVSEKIGRHGHRFHWRELWQGNLAAGAVPRD